MSCSERGQGEDGGCSGLTKWVARSYWWQPPHTSYHFSESFIIKLLSSLAEQGRPRMKRTRISMHPSCGLHWQGLRYIHINVMIGISSQLRCPFGPGLFGSYHGHTSGTWCLHGYWWTFTECWWMMSYPMTLLFQYVQLMILSRWIEHCAPSLLDVNPWWPMGRNNNPHYSWMVIQFVADIFVDLPSSTLGIVHEICDKSHTLTPPLPRICRILRPSNHLLIPHLSWDFPKCTTC